MLDRVITISITIINLLQGNWLVVSTSLKNMSSSMGRIIPYEMDNKIHVWNHQPVFIHVSTPLKNMSQLGWWNSQYMET